MKTLSKSKTKIVKTQAGRARRSALLDIADRERVEELFESEELYRLVFNNGNDAAFVSLGQAGGNMPGRFILVNDIACQWLGYSREELLQMSPLDISVPLPTIDGVMKKLAMDKRVIHEEIHITKDGRKIPVEISTRAFELNGKQVNLSSARDISERRLAEETLRLQSAALNATANAIVITDRDGTIQWVNPAWSTLTGYSSQEAIGQNPRILKSGLQNVTYYKNLWDAILAGKVWRGELINKRKDGGLYSEEQTITPVHNTSSEITHFIAIKQDITERKRMEEKLKQLSIHDTLTGLYNRGFFEEELARLERGQQFPVSIVMADVDHLKDINDLHGHTVGDALLKRAAQVLNAAFRSDDVVARIGGDEFAVILPNTDVSTAETVLLRVRYSLQKHNAAQADAPLSISFGISAAENLKSLLEALKEADANMYREKRERHNI